MREGGRWPLRLYESYLNFNGKIILLDLGWAVCVSCPWSSLDLSVFLTSWFSLVAAHLSRVLVSVGSRCSSTPTRSHFCLREQGATRVKLWSLCHQPRIFSIHRFISSFSRRCFGYGAATGPSVEAPFSCSLLALIKYWFHVPTYWVNIYNNHVFTLSANRVPQF
jgi:hypothetical protein